MKRSVVMLVAVVAGVGAAFGAKALGFESLISRTATFAVVAFLIFGGLNWTRKPKS